MKRVAVLDDYDGSIAKLPCWKRLDGVCSVEFFGGGTEPHELVDFECLVTVRERTILTREFLKTLRNLRHVAITGRSSGQVDEAALAERGITLSQTPGGGGSAPELTVALMLASLRGIPRRDRLMREGGWHDGPATELAGKTLGVLGMGKIGGRVAAVGKALDMRVVSWGPSGLPKPGFERLPLDEVMRVSDVVCICLKLSDQTRGVVGRAQLAAMRDGAWLVNTARADIVEKKALYAELESGRLNAALDVFHTEPLPTGDKLRRLPNVVLSPHMGYVTHESYGRFFGAVVENLLNLPG